MSRYDGLIIPRSYSEYINKTDAATLLQALQLSGVMDNAPTANSNHPTKSSGVYTALNNITPVNSVTAGQTKPPTSNAVYDYVKGYKAIDNSVRVNGNQTYKTNINVNTGTNQKNGYIALVMGNIGAGSNTYVKIYLLRTGYDGNYLFSTLLHESGNSASSTFTFAVSDDGYITFTTSIDARLEII
jgi:hypothetical protein